MGKKISLNDFIKRSNEKHGDKYDYSQSDISGGVHKPLKIICPKHGEFYQAPAEHMAGADCPKCAYERVHNAQRKTQDSFIEQAKKVWGDRYDLSKVIYLGAKEKICVICPQHGEFWIYPNDFLHGHGCQACGGVKKLDTETFIERAKRLFGDKYSYNNVNYKNYSAYVDITCPIHGDFKITPRNFFNGYGCPKCAQSHLEKTVEIFFSQKNLEFKYQYKPLWAGKLRFDFYLPHYNAIIECQGRQHFMQIDYFKGADGYKYTISHDLLKSKLCKENGVALYYLCSKNVSIPEELHGIYTKENTFLILRHYGRQ